MEKITITSTSLHTAKATDIILRDKQMTQLVFRPLLVDNEKEPEAAVKGQFLFEKKLKKDKWQPTAAINLAHLKAGRKDNQLQRPISKW